MSKRVYGWSAPAGSLYGLDVLDRVGSALILDDAAVRRRLEADEDDHRVRVVDRHANLGVVAVAQDVREDQRVLVDHAVLETRFFMMPYGSS